MKNGRIKVFFSVIFSFLILSVAITYISAENSYSNIYTTIENYDIAQFKKSNKAASAPLRFLSNTGEYLPDGQKDEDGILFYSFSSESRDSTFTAEIDKPLDLYLQKKLKFIVSSDCIETHEHYFTVILYSGEERLTAKGIFRTGEDSQITLDISSWKYRCSVDKISIMISSSADSCVNENARFSMPYISSNVSKPDRYFISDDITATGTGLKYVKDIYKHNSISIKLQNQRTALSGNILLSYSESLRNAIRIVLSNDSDYKEMTLQYIYVDKKTGQYVSSSKIIEIAPRSKNHSYLVLVDDVERISSFSLSFDGTNTGTAVFHKIEAVAVYSGEDSASNGTVESCIYSPQGDSIKISGTVFHNFFITHSDYLLYCYKLEGGETLSDIIERGDEPTAKSKMSTRFTFTLKTSKLGKLPQIARYAIVAAKGDEIILIASPASPTNEKNQAGESTGTQNGQKINSFKGIYSENISPVHLTNAGSAIVDVYLDKMTNETQSGILTTVEDIHIYYNSDYVASVDNKIKALTASGTNVYLRILISDNAKPDVIPYISENAPGAALYLAPTIDSDKSEIYFFGAIDFLTKRYSQSEDMRISGLILGKSIDLMEEYNYSEFDEITSYAASVAKSFSIMAKAAKINNNSISAILPISENSSDTRGFDTELLLTSLCCYFDSIGGLDFSLMLEGTHSPFLIDRRSLDGFSFSINEMGEVTEIRMKDGSYGFTPSGDDCPYYLTDSLSRFERVIVYLSRQSKSYPTSYTYLWSPDIKELSDTILPLYGFSYLSLFESEKCSGFFLELTEPYEKYNVEFFDYIKYIDSTKNSKGELTNYLAELFPMGDADNFDSTVKKEVYIAPSIQISDYTNLGKFVYRDFSEAVNTPAWILSDGCDSVMFKHTPTGEKALCAEFVGDNALCGEIIYKLDIPENMTFAPLLAFDIFLEGTENMPYDIYIRLGTSCGIIESQISCEGNKDIRAVIDLEGIECAEQVNYICISVINEESDNVNLYISEISGYSARFSDEEISTLVREARDSYKADLPTSSGSVEKKLTDVRIIVMVVIVMFIGVLFVGFYEKKQQIK